MKKMYVAPAVEINETMACQMMALSIMDGKADDSEVLGKGQQDWDMWYDDDED